MRKLTILFGSLWLASCAVGPNYHKPEVKSAEKFESVSQTYSQEDAVAQFWTQFNDPTLDSLVTDALGANHDLRIALARFTEARAARGESKFDLAPTITASGGYTEQTYPQPQRATIPGGNTKFWDAGFDAVWELDF